MKTLKLFLAGKEVTVNFNTKTESVHWVKYGNMINKITILPHIFTQKELVKLCKYALNQSAVAIA